MESSAPFYVIGHPLGHSMSPFIHARLFAAQGREERYTSRDIPPETLDTALPALLKESGGINVTIPYKQAVSRRGNRPENHEWGKFKKTSKR